MYWVVQSNLFREDGHARLLDALDRFALPYALVEVRHFTDHIEAPIPIGPVWAMGSYKLVRILAESGRRPGAYTQGLRVDKLQWPRHDMLNGKARRGSIRSLPEEVKSPVFLRPVEDSKAFSGQVLDPEEYASWRARVLECGPEDNVNGATVVLMSEPKRLFSETRFWVVGSEIATSSVYRLGGRVRYIEGAASPVVEAFAQAKAREWGPNPAYVMDIADTEEGPKIVECNCLNAAGFYAADMMKLVGYIEAFHTGVMG